MKNFSTERIETPRLILRKARDTDLEKIWRNVWQDEGLAKMMLWSPTKDRESAVVRMEKTVAYQKDRPAFFVCLKDTDEPIGFAGMVNVEGGTFEETGVCIAKAYQRRGLGKETLRALVSLAFEGFGGDAFICGCFRENAASAALIKSCGFTYTHSEEKTRGCDGYVYVCDFYELKK